MQGVTHMSYTSLSDLRKSRGNFDNLMKEVEKIAKPTTGERRDDDRIWSPAVDKAGNGYAVNLPDPVSELNSELWNSGIESNKEIARKQKRRLNYIANILVVKDSVNPQNEGKVFLYKFGKKIFDKIKDIMQPQFEDEEPINPFDFWKGANFKLKIRNVEGYRNYDKSEFDPATAIASTDDEIEAVWDQQHALQPFVDANNFKSYEELKKKLDMVLKGSPVASMTADKLSETRMEEESVSEAPKIRSTPTPSFKASAADDDDDTLSYFSKLAED